jgi:hypothetical protein
MAISVRQFYFLGRRRSLQPEYFLLLFGFHSIKWRPVFRVAPHMWPWCHYMYRHQRRISYYSSHALSASAATTLCLTFLWPALGYEIWMYCPWTTRNNQLSARANHAIVQGRPRDQPTYTGTSVLTTSESIIHNSFELQHRAMLRIAIYAGSIAPSFPWFPCPMQPHTWLVPILTSLSLTWYQHLHDPNRA